MELLSEQDMKDRGFTEDERARYYERLRIETDPNPRKGLTTEEMREKYDVVGFMAPYVVVLRKSDGKEMTLSFQHSPRLYFEDE